MTAVIPFLQKWALDKKKEINFKKLEMGDELIVETEEGMHFIKILENNQDTVSVQYNGNNKEFVLIPSLWKICAGVKDNDVEKINDYLSNSVQLYFRGSRFNQQSESLLLDRIMHQRCMEFSLGFKNYFYTLVSSPVIAATIHGKDYKYKLDW